MYLRTTYLESTILECCFEMRVQSFQLGQVVNLILVTDLELKRLREKNMNKNIENSTRLSIIDNV